MGSIETKTNFDVAAISSAQTSANDLKRSLDDWGSTASSARSSARGGWEGMGADAFDKKLRNVIGAIDKLEGKVGDYASAIATLHGELDAVKSTLDGIRTNAVSKGLTVTGTLVMEPEAPVIMQSPDAPPPTAENTPEIAKYEQKISDYNAFVTEHNDARSKESRAHNAFQDACAKIVRPEGWEVALKILGLPTSPDDMCMWLSEKLSDAAQVFGVAMVAGSSVAPALSSDGARAIQAAATSGARRALIPPVEASNALERFRNMLKDSKNAGNPKNWTPAAAPKRGLGIPDGSRLVASSTTSGGQKIWSYAGKFGSVLKWGTAAYESYNSFNEQWARDSHDPTLSTEEKVTRGTAKAAWDVGPALAGGAAGGKIGAAIGTAIAPGVGTIVGGIVGGFVGGAIGGLAKSSLDGAVKGLIDKIRW